MRLIPATPRLLRAAAVGPAELAAELAVEVPDGWPEFPAAIPATIEFLRLFPEQSAWSMYFFVDEDATSLLGSGGFKGAPANGMVQIGYEVAPCWRGQGVATRAVSALIDVARASDEVHTIAAHTLGTENHSVSVLRKQGFTKVSTAADGSFGEIWRWERTIPPNAAV